MYVLGSLVREYRYGRQAARWAVFIAAAIFFLSLSSVAHALTVSPARLEVTGDPGRTISGDFLLMNEQKEQKTFYSSFENFEAQGESGSPNFIPGQDGLATWIDAPAQVILGPGEQRVIPFSVSIPTGAEPG